MSPEDIDQVAEAVVGKIQQGLLRMPDDLRAALAGMNYPAGYFSAPGTLMPSPNAYYMEVLSRASGIELRIKRPDGSLCWQSVIV